MAPTFLTAPAIADLVEPHTVPTPWRQDTELTVVAWRDSCTEAEPDAIATASDDALVWFTPQVGTLAMMLAHRMATYVAHGPTVWTVHEIARTFGLQEPSRVRRAFDRLDRFHIARRQQTTIAVRLALPPLTSRQRAQLPAYLRTAYDAR
jgi:hypothetical protein